jgi:hypothetical protein
VLKAILMLVSLLSLTGCLTSNVLVTVRPDGTGTIEHTTTLRPSAMTELEKLLPPEATGNPPGAVSVRPPLQTLTAPRESSAWLWGRSVRMRSTRPLNTAETIGWKTIYDFDDVTSLGVDLMPVTPGLRSFYSLAAAERRATTRLQMSVEPIADGIERLTVHFPRFAMDPSAEPPAAAVSGPAADMAALRNLLRGSRITVAIQTEGPLLRTNSPHRAADEVAETAMIKHLFNARPSERASISTGALVRPVANVLDPFLAWTPDGTLLMAVNSTLYRWRSGDPNWTVVANLGGFGLRNVTRLAVSPKGDRLAIVAEAR